MRRELHVLCFHYDLSLLGFFTFFIAMYHQNLVSAPGDIIRENAVFDSKSYICTDIRMISLASLNINQCELLSLHRNKYHSPHILDIQEGMSL